ncbi:MULTISPECIES: helix-turn-helix domain-containing protein [Bacteria]
MSQPALSAVTGIQQSEISRIESGAANPTVATISKLADALDLKLSLTPQH